MIFFIMETGGEINLFNNSWVKNDNGLNDVVTAFEAVLLQLQNRK